MVEMTKTLKPIAVALALAGAALTPAAGAHTVSRPGLPQGSDPVTLDPARFTTDIDNPYWPMRPGSRWISRETDDQGNAFRVVVRVTNRIKTISGGIQARVVRDVVSRKGEPVEVTDDWYAQDDLGNIWYLGEDTAEYENGKVVSREGSFEHGVDGAYAGVIMPANPEAGLCYRQEYYKGQAEDGGCILSVGEQAEASAGHFSDVVITKEFVPLEPRVLELKFFAKGVGPVQAIGISGGRDREDLVRFRRG
jgi:hypothetical protein